MSLLHKSLADMQESDLELLLINRVAESKELDYKKEFPDKKKAQEDNEFLYDVASFANTIGGDIIFGIEENGNGEPKAIIGVESNSTDSEILRLRALLNSNMDPRINGVTMRAIPLKTGKVVVIVRIPQSWSAPHRETKTSRFYVRADKGKYILDTNGIRNLFGFSEALYNKMVNFRLERLGKIISNEGSVQMASGSKMVVHILPLQSFNSAKYYNISRENVGFNSMLFNPAGSFSISLNFEGVVVSVNGLGENANIPVSYCQFFREGIVELVDIETIDPFNANKGSSFQARSTESNIQKFSTNYEEAVINGISRHLNFLKNLGISLPIFVCLSLLGVKNKYLDLDIAKNIRYFTTPPIPIRNNDLLLDAIQLDSFDHTRDTLAQTLRPAFNRIWNASGLEYSYNYNQTGGFKFKN